MATLRMPDVDEVVHERLRRQAAEPGRSVEAEVRALCTAAIDQLVALHSIDVAGTDPATAIHQRSDVCAVPAAGVVAQAMVALVLAEACVEKFGGDSVAETARNHRAYLDAIPELMRTWEP